MPLMRHGPFSRKKLASRVAPGAVCFLTWIIPHMLGWTVSPAEEKHVCYPSRYACPVTANLFPKQQKESGSIRFIFPENSIPRRISIALLSPGGLKTNVEFTWIGIKETRPPYIDWGTRSGSFIVRGDGGADCFFLGYEESGIPGNIPCKEFQLRIPAGIQIKDIKFSSLPSAIPPKTCPMPELEKSINQAIEDYQSNPQDEKKALYTLQLLEKAVPQYDCRRRFDYAPIPAWWMADYGSIDRWIEYMYKEVLEHNSYALKVYVEYYSTSDGYIAEGMSFKIWELLKHHPTFILDNWETIKDLKPAVLRCLFMKPEEAVIDLINVYQSTGAEHPKYKPTCDEIIGTIKLLMKKAPSSSGEAARQRR
jgi:hypothetical protein